MASLRCGQLSGFAAAVLFGCSAPLISTFTASGSSLSIAGLLYAGATLALAIVRLMKGRTQDESPLQRRDAPALAGLILLGGIVGPVALVHGLARLPAASRPASSIHRSEDLRAERRRFSGARWR